MEEPEVNKVNAKSEPELFARAMKGGWWIFGSRLLQQLLAMTRLVVLARILKPADFGLLGMALLTISILNQFSMTGFNVALIQKKSDIEDYLSSAWTFGLIRGAVLYCILFTAAPYAAVFFDSPDVAMIIRVIGLSAILTSFNNIGIIFFHKELDFRRQFIFINLGTLADVTVAIILAFIYRSVWALVAGQLAGMLVRCILSYVLHDYRPRLQLKWNKIGEMWRYGKHVMAISILSFFCLEGDDIFLGKVLGIHVLGLYRYAYKVSNMMATEIANLVGRIAFPVFSKLQDNIDKLRYGFIKASQVAMLIVLPISGGLIILANELTFVVFGPEWLDMAPSIQILCILGLAKSNQMGSVFKSLDRPDIIKWVVAMNFVLIVLMIYPLTMRFGMAGTAASVTIPCVITHPILLCYLKKLIGYPIRDYIKLVSLPILATVIMMWIVFFARMCFVEVGIFSLLVLIAVGVVSYCLLILGLVRFYKEYNLTEIVRNLAGGLK